MFEGIGGDDETNALTTTSQLTTKDKPTSTNSSNEAEEDDPLAELKTLATAPRTSTSSRPNTPHLASSTATSTRTRSPAGHRVYTPTTGSGRSSEEKAAAERQGVETQKVFQAPQAPASHSQQAEAEGGGGGWWGGFSALASAAVKQGQAAFQEIQQNEEAQRWAEQMRGNVGALRGIGKVTRCHGFELMVDIFQVGNCRRKPCRHSQIYYKPSLLQSHNMNACRSTLLMTSSTTLHSTHSSTRPSRA